MNAMWNAWGHRACNWLLGTLMGLCLLLALLLSCLIGRVGVNKNLYHTQQVALEIAGSVGMEQQELDRVTVALIDYLQGKRDAFQIEAVMDGALQPLYTQREIDHMVDVRALFQLGVNVQGWVTLAGALLGFGLWLLNGEDVWFGEVCRGLLRGAVAGLILIMLVSFVAGMDFAMAFEAFHRIFFTNDLWQLSETDFLIRIMPLDFFVAMAVRVAVWFLGILSFAAALVFTIYQRWKAGGFRFTRPNARKAVPAAKAPARVRNARQADTSVISRKKRKRR